MRLLSRFRTDQACHCPLATIELLDGQHPEQCRRNRIGRRRGLLRRREHLAPVTVDPQLPHMAHGLIMPWVWGPAPDGDIKPPVKLLNHNVDHCCIDHIWCDMSAAGDGGFVARRWQDLKLCATVINVDGRWHWTVLDLTVADGSDSVFASGVSHGTCDTALRDVGFLIEDVHASRLEANSCALDTLRDEI